MSFPCAEQSGLFPLFYMREGFILLHRQSITRGDWKCPERTLAWIDLLTLANYEDGVVTASYGFLANRWRVGKSTVFKWMTYWKGERQCERLSERDSERKGERFFIVNYAKYQNSGERKGERQSERKGERQSELRYKDSSSKSVEPITTPSVLPPVKGLSPAAIKNFVPERNEILAAFKAAMGQAVLDGSEKMNSVAAKRILLKALKATNDDRAKAMRNILGAISLVPRDPYHGPKCTSLLYLERHWLEILRKASASISKTVVITSPPTP